mmetsp:Transcript_127885/g.409633  ORF Transcript_127885/g.409633 Transcript_127885/m.409633 type:complete len:126 (-) Transcript_127885:103-480(-)
MRLARLNRSLMMRSLLEVIVGWQRLHRHASKRDLPQNIPVKVQKSPLQASINNWHRIRREGCTRPRLVGLEHRPISHHTSNRCRQILALRRVVVEQNSMLHQVSSWRIQVMHGYRELWRVAWLKE